MKFEDLATKEEIKEIFKELISLKTMLYNSNVEPLSIDMREVSRITGFSKSVIEKAISDGELKPFKITPGQSNSKLMFLYADIKRWIFEKANSSLYQQAS